MTIYCIGNIYTKKKEKKQGPIKNFYILAFTKN